MNYKALDLKYKCYGYCYRVYWNNNKLDECRSSFEIISKSLLQNAELQELSPQFLTSFHKPDALIIMMNPGSSKPQYLNNGQDKVCVENFMIDLFNTKRVLARPDDTQYRVMKVMEEMNWYYVRVINLSDIRELHNSKLLSRIKSFETKSLSCVHSIFSPNRRSELTDAMKIKEDAPTILA